MKLYFFGILVSSIKHKTFAEVHGDLMVDDLYMAAQAVTAYAEGITRKSGGDLQLVGGVIKEADLVELPNYV